MVVFTCQHCGEPVKKPLVSKHYERKCHGRLPDLTCVDCLKDFRGNAYEAHTKCISESERYGAKGSIQPNSVNKGNIKSLKKREVLVSKHWYDSGHPPKLCLVLA